jgi:hypothetical protein
VRTSLKVAVALIVILALFGVWMGAVFHWLRTVSPGGSTLAPCLEKLGASVSAAVFVHDGNEFLLLVGESRAFPRFPSGPPHYVFDRTGALVDWVPDSGDAENRA